jgi:phosphoglycolate phosphatase-like HAD superfamily hydrolase
VAGVLVLWDVDHTLIHGGPAGGRLYSSVFRELFGRELPGVAPMAGRTDRAIILDTLTLAGIRDPGRHVGPFLAGLAAQAPELRARIAADGGYALPGALAALAAVAAVAGPPPVAVQSVLTGNVPAIAEAKLAAFGLTAHLDLAVGAYGDHHEVRAELVHLARRQATLAYGRDFAGPATVLIGDTPLDVAAALATGARAVGVASGSATMAELAAAGAGAVLPDLTDTPAVLAALLGDPAPATPA